MFHPRKQEGEDPCDSVHSVPDKCKGREERQRPKPGKNQKCNVQCIGNYKQRIEKKLIIWGI